MRNMRKIRKIREMREMRKMRKMRKMREKRKMRKMRMSKEKIMKIETKRAIFFPEDIVLNILLRLPARSVAKFRCVSKSWLFITSSPSFVRNHAIHSRGSHQSLILQSQQNILSSEEIAFLDGRYFFLAFANAYPGVGITVSQLQMLNREQRSYMKASCDGLIFIDGWRTMKYAVVNPLTGHSVNIPQPKDAEDWGISFFCLYFHHSTSKYRLLRAADDRRSKNYVLDIGGKNSWRHIPSRRPAFDQHPHAVDVNGRLHWLAFKQKDHPHAISFETPYDIVMTFDKETEVFSFISLPLPEKRSNRGGNLMDFNKGLGFWVAGNDGVIDVWIMEECWIKKHSIICDDLRGCLSILKTRWVGAWVIGNAVCIGNEELLIDLMASSELHYLVRWNLKSGAYVVQSIGGYYHEVYYTFSYTPTLLSPSL